MTEAIISLDGGGSKTSLSIIDMSSLRSYLSHGTDIKFVNDKKINSEDNKNNYRLSNYSSDGNSMLNLTEQELNNMVLFNSISTGSNLNSVPFKEVYGAFKSLLEDARNYLKSQNDIKLVGTVLATAGLSVKGRKEKFEHILKELGFPENIHIVSDNEAAYKSAYRLYGADALLIVGTGSIISSRSCDGLEVRAGGHGQFFSDQGSSYDLARRIIEIYLYMQDGLIDKSPLYDTVQKYLKKTFLNMNIDENLDSDEYCLYIIHKLNSNEYFDRSKIAGLCKYLDFDESYTKEALTNAAYELAKIIYLFYKKYYLGKNMNFICTGSLIRNCSTYKDKLLEGIRKIIIDKQESINPDAISFKLMGSAVELGGVIDYVDSFNDKKNSR